MVGFIGAILVGIGMDLVVAPITFGVLLIHPLAIIANIILAIISGCLGLPCGCCLCTGLVNGLLIPLIGSIGISIYGIAFSVIGGSIYWIPIDILFSAPLIAYPLCRPIDAILSFSKVFENVLNSMFNFCSLKQVI